jgi:hypothetical protein
VSSTSPNGRHQASRASTHDHDVTLFFVHYAFHSPQFG